METHHRISQTAWSTLVALTLASCGGGSGGDASSGTLRVSLTDAPACGYDHVYVTVSKVSIHASATATDNAPGWTDLIVSPARRLDLLSLTNGALETLGQTPLPAGNYRQVRLVLAENSSSSAMANAVMPSGGAEMPLDTPSAQQSGLKMPVNLEVLAGQTLDIAIDFDACKSIVKAGNSGKHLLKPVLSVIPMVSSGAIAGYVAPPAADTPVTVTAQAGAAVVKSTQARSDGYFKLSPLPNGSYTVALSAPGRTSYVVRAVPVTIGTDTLLSSPPGLALITSATGTASGSIAPATSTAHLRALQASALNERVEIASTNADAVTGAYALTLPTAPIQVATWSAPVPPATVPVLAFAPYGSGGTYTLDASATGFTTQQADVTVTAGGTTLHSFTLTPTP